MGPEVSDLLKLTLALPVDERAALANTLLDSLETTNESVGLGRRSGTSNRRLEGGPRRDCPLGGTASRTPGLGESAVERGLSRNGAFILRRTAYPLLRSG